MARYIIRVESGEAESEAIVRSFADRIARSLGYGGDAFSVVVERANSFGISGKVIAGWEHEGDPREEREGNELEDGTSGQDRESYSDTQDRENYEQAQGEK